MKLRGLLRRGAASAGALLLLAASPARGEGPAPLDPPGWVAPRRARIAPFSIGTASTGAPQEADPSAPISLSPDKVLLVPIDPGDRLRITGPVAAIGLGSGVRDVPDVITWLPLPDEIPAANGKPAARLVDVPMWTAARFLVVRADKPAQIGLSAASLTRSAMGWYRLEEDVSAWLRDASKAVPSTTIPEAGAGLRWAVAAHAALSGAPEEATADWLTVRWLEASFGARPLVEPYFFKRSITVSGGREVTDIVPEPDASPWRAALGPSGSGGSPARMVIDAPGSDAVRLLVQARGIGAARAIVRVGDFIVRELVWDVALRTADERRWTAANSLRLPLPLGAQRVVIEAITGEIAVSATGYRSRPATFDVIPRHRSREARLDALAASPTSTPAGAVLRLLGAADRSASSRDAEAALARARQPDVPPPVRALVLAEAMRWAKSPEDARRAAERAFEASRALPPASAAPILRAVLERLTALHAEALPPPRPWSAPLTVPAHDEDRGAIDALRAALSPPEDGRRPDAAPLAERYAWMHADLEDASERARRAWVREAPWDTLDPVPGTAIWNELTIPMDVFGSTRCKVTGSRGPRWTLLGEGKTTITVAPAPSPATHARVLVLPMRLDPEPEATLLVDGVAASAHTGAGLGTTIAVAPGVRVFERPTGAVPIVARIPREGDAPCASLREMSRWISLNGRLTFAIPDPGRATVARVVVYAESSLASKPRRLRVVVGTRIHEAWVRDAATGAIEVPVPADIREISVETDEQTLLRVSARLHPRPATPPRVASAGVVTAPETIEALLARVREATRAIESGSPAAADEGRKKRAAALDELGYASLAALDRGEDPTLEPAEDLTPAPVQALALPPNSPAVVPFGLPARVPPLPLPGDTVPLGRARRAEAAGDAGLAIATLTEGGARASTGADALLLAALAERVGTGWIAAEILERIGLTHGSGAALARAAALSADRAGEEGDRARALRSFVLAQIAADNGDPASSAFARLSPAISWYAATRADSAAGTGLVDFRGGREPLPLGVRVRRALLGAPDDALLLAEGQHVEVRIKQAKSSFVGVETICRALEPSASCQLSVIVDGAPAPCGDPASSRGQCTLTIPPGSHRVEIRGPKNRDVLGATRLTTSGGFALEPRVVSEWFDIDPARPLELTFAAPTVVRLQARGPAGEPRTLNWSISPPLDRQTGPSRGELVLDSIVDPAAQLVGGDPKTLLPLGREGEKRIAILGGGSRLLRVESPGGRSLVRVQLAVSVGLPRPKRAPALPAAPPPSPQFAPDAPYDHGPDVVDDPDPGPGTLSGYAQYSDLDLSDEDRLTGARQLELGIIARRELLPLRAWASASIFGRARFGAPSFGVATWFDLASDGFIPGFFARGRVVTQIVPEGVALGVRGTLGPLWTIPIGESFTLLPWAGAGLVHTDPILDGKDDADREIYTDYWDTHPFYGMLGLRAYVRPVVDGIVNFGVSARSMPDFAGLDRVDGELNLDLLAGRGYFPWINLGAFASYRPASAYRDESFVRTGVAAQLTFWSWLSRGHRLSASGQARLLFDIPKEESPFRVSWGIFLGYDFTGRRGLRDFAPREVTFRPRLEEGSGRIDRRQTSADPTWGPGP
ncbi:hypothetical protein [Polyangium aurulentum]|uniref:hypothetical protein n=1 Tax=Polyangium aurulentum TaxID=2567896 RepID=UPI0010AE75A5|nr:hypothetical protein [Polyangium aurulentum]UQA62885.1 hypothetical protein E8A73_021495 [Polyangium aurulentum]